MKENTCVIHWRKFTDSVAQWESFATNRRPLKNKDLNITSVCCEILLPNALSTSKQQVIRQLFGNNATFAPKSICRLLADSDYLFRAGNNSGLLLFTISYIKSKSIGSTRPKPAYSI
jgi:hypothetical protein